MKFWLPSTNAYIKKVTFSSQKLGACGPTCVQCFQNKALADTYFAKVVIKCRNPKHLLFVQLRLSVLGKTVHLVLSAALGQDLRHSFSQYRQLPASK